MAYYVQPHVTQFDGAPRQGEACVPASCANGVAAQSGGAKRPSSGAVHALVPKAVETDPNTPGWSMPDAARAMTKLGVQFEVHNGWDALVAVRKTGHYTILIGDSDRFANSTCSGAFDGDHCIGIHPNTKVVDGVEWWWIDDPICKTFRWERRSTLRDYAEKLAEKRHDAVTYGVFMHPVPTTAAPAPTVVLRYGAHKLVPSRVKTIRVPAGHRANVRRTPSFKGTWVTSFANGHQWRAYQAVKLSSGVWYGGRLGRRWLHESAF